MYALTPWGAELRAPIEGLIRWSTPLMTDGPEGDRFRAEWLVVALPTLLTGTTVTRRSTRRSSTVGIAVDSQLLDVTMTRSGIAVSLHDGRDVDAVVRADPSVILGLAAGVLDLQQVRGLIEIEGDEKAARALFGTEHADADSSER